MNKFVVVVDDETYQVVVAPADHWPAWGSGGILPNTGLSGVQTTVEPAARLRVQVDGQPAHVIIPKTGSNGGEIDWVIVDGRPYEIDIDAQQHWMEGPDGRHRVQVRATEPFITRPVIKDGLVSAPIPGRVVRVLVITGQTVEAGQPLVILEAMKMENEIRAVCPGMVQAVHIEPGQCVKHGEKLVEIA